MESSLLLHAHSALFNFLRAGFNGGDFNAIEIQHSSLCAHHNPRLLYGTHSVVTVLRADEQGNSRGNRTRHHWRDRGWSNGECKECSDRRGAKRYNRTDWRLSNGCSRTGCLQNYRYLEWL